ncbi:DNA-3-methyladenine glycosylase [soil metagenome]
MNETRDEAAAAELSAPVAQAAFSLLGRRLAHGDVVLRLTEVEAYGGEGDPASHAWRGRTPRNQTMFGPAGVAYVYRSYGLHWCLNVVAEPDGLAAAVLLRAGQVLEGVTVATARRASARQPHELARGPGRLTQALGVDVGQQGADLLRRGSELQLLPPDPAAGAPAVEDVACGRRVGVSRAANLPWRFWLRGDPTVSAYRRSPRAPKPAC